MATTPNAPSAGAEVNTGTVETPTPSAPAAPLTDEQILGIDQEEPATPAAEAGEQVTEKAPSEEAQVQPEEKPEEAAEKIEPDEEVTVPEDLKALFKMEGVGPKVRDLFYRHAEYQKTFPTVAEAREYRQLYPNLEMAKTASNDAAELERFDSLFYTQDPADKKAFLKSLQEADSEHFEGLVQSLPDALSEVSPELYRSALAIPVTRDVLRNLAAMAAAEGGERGENLKNAVDVVALRLFRKAFEEADRESALPDPRSDALSKREQNLRTREAEVQTRQVKEFSDRVNERAVTDVMKTVRTSVDKLLEGSGVTEGAKNRIAGEIYRAIDETLRTDRELQRQVRRTLREGDFGNDHQQKIAGILIARYKALIRPTAQKVVSQWTKDLLGLNQQKRDKQQQAGQRKDIGGAVPSGRPQVGPRVTPDKLDYSQLTDDDILDGKVALRK